MSNKIFYTYKIFNIVVGKFYFGSRTISKRIDILDGYNTSSKVVHNLINLYGLDSFILVEYNIFDSMNLAIEHENLYLKSIVDKSEYLNINFSAGGAVIKSQTHNKLYNPKKDIYAYYPKNIDIPDGWIKKVKNPPPPRMGFRKHINVINKDIIMCLPSKVPDGYKLYSEYLLENKPPIKNIFITDGVNNTKISKLDDLPDGWFVGKTVKFTKHCINNGLVDIYVDKNSKIPDGWVRGRKCNSNMSTTKDRIAINNGSLTKMINKDDIIPDGWVLGGLSSGKYNYIYKDITFHRKKDLIKYLNTTPTKFDVAFKRGIYDGDLRLVNKGED